MNCLGQGVRLQTYTDIPMDGFCFALRGGEVFLTGGVLYFSNTVGVL